MNSKFIVSFFTFIFFVSFGLKEFSVTAQNSTPVREDIEWLDVWLPHTNDKELPRVLLIGNSITRAYYPEVESLLGGKAYVGRLCTSKSIGDPALSAEIALILSCEKFDIIQFNNGMHGWGYTEDEYKRSFPELIKTIKEHAPNAKLIWATTTPVRTGDGMMLFDSRTDRVRERNRIAEAAVKDQNIRINDLFELVENHPEFYAGGDGTHPEAKGVTALANQVAAVISELLNEK